jgi:hypothetical protein
MNDVYPQTCLADLMADLPRAQLRLAPAPVAVQLQLIGNVDVAVSFTEKI